MKAIISKEYLVMGKQDDYIKTALRLPRDVHENVRAAAEEKGVSMNDEIIRRLSGDSTVADIIRTASEQAARAKAIVDKSAAQDAIVQEMKQIADSNAVAAIDSYNKLDSAISLMVSLLENKNRTQDDENSVLIGLMKILSSGR